jgi:DNA-binding transcriptional LysR family regulator
MQYQRQYEQARGTSIPRAGIDPSVRSKIKLVACRDRQGVCQRARAQAPEAVGRHVSALESSFGIALFTRSQTGLLPTEAALALRPYAETMRSTAEALRRAADSQGGEGVKGTVRVSASEVIGVEVLPTMVAQLRQAYPQLKVELVITNRLQDLLRREADIAVRMAAPKQELLIARRVGVVPEGLFAHRSYLARHGTPKSVPDLARHALIGFDEETPFVRAARKAWPEWNRAAFSIRTDSDVGQLALIRAGCGIGACQVALAKRSPELTRVLSQKFEFNLDTWVTMHEDLRNSPRCKVTFDALVTGLAAHVS